MGMDVYGMRPNSETGEYFRRNISGWPPLATLCEMAAPDVCKYCECWYSNDGDGLNERHATDLACILEKAINDGSITPLAINVVSEYPDRYTPTELIETAREFIAFLKDCGGFEIC
jgi:hypothetical protein